MGIGRGFNGSIKVGGSSPTRPPLDPPLLRSTYVAHQLVGSTTQWVNLFGPFSSLMGSKDIKWSIILYFALVNEQSRVGSSFQKTEKRIHTLKNRNVTVSSRKELQHTAIALVTLLRSVPSLSLIHAPASWSRDMLGFQVRMTAGYTAGELCGEMHISPMPRSQPEPTNASGQSFQLEAIKLKLIKWPY